MIVGVCVCVFFVNLIMLVHRHKHQTQHFVYASRVGTYALGIDLEHQSEWSELYIILIYYTHVIMCVYVVSCRTQVLRVVPGAVRNLSHWCGMMLLSPPRQVLGK